MVTLTRIGSKDVRYNFVEELLHTAFPEAERRNDDEQRWNADHEARFHCLLATDGQEPVGLLTYWDFDTFIYIEHLATAPYLRGQGIGKEMVCTFFEEHLSKPVVLEVEVPTDEMSRRRIGFYERCGLHLWECDYRQPPYRNSDGWLPMYLMASSGLSKEKDYQHIQNSIHQEVYRMSSLKERQ